MFTVSGSIICKYGHAQLDLKNMLFSACTRSVVPHPTTRLIRLALPHPVASCLRCCLLPDLCGPVHSASAASFKLGPRDSLSTRILKRHGHTLVANTPEADTVKAVSRGSMHIGKGFFRNCW